MRISDTMPMDNTGLRTRENDIWTYDTPDSGSGTTGAIMRMHIQVRRKNVRKMTGLYNRLSKAAVDHIHGVGDGDGNAVGVSCPAIPGLQCA